MLRARYSFPWPSDEADASGIGIPGHDLKEILGQGGMGAVHRARQESLGRDVALKIIVPHRNSPEDRDRFLREARVLAQLDHPNIVPIYDYGIDSEDRCFYSMKLVRGRTLTAIISAIGSGKEVWTIKRRLEIFRKVCDAIAFAHSRGVMHRDLKPDNIMVGEFGEVLVMDWGLAGDLFGPAEDNASPQSLSPSRRPGPVIGSDVALTLEGDVLGTPQYMAPEQANACRELDERCDIYALGGVLYSILTLRPPMKKGAINEMLESVRSGRIEPFGFMADPKEQENRTQRIPAPIAAVIRKAMALDREQRFAFAGALISDVDAYLAGFATSAEHINLAGQFWLLVKRHRTVSTAVAVLLFMSLAFVIELVGSERRATDNAFLARHNEDIARASESATRMALAKAQIALADSAYAANDTAEMRQALDGVPIDLRDSTWHYLDVRTDERESLPAWNGDGFLIGSTAHPSLPGVFTVATSADAHRIVDVDARSGKTLRDFSQRGGWVRAIAYSGDASLIAIGRIMEGGISIHRAEDGAEVLHWNAGWVDHLAFHPDGKRLFQSDNNGCVMWDSATGQSIWKSPHGKTHYLIPDGRRIVSVSEVNLRLLSAEDGSVLATYPIKPVSPITASLSPEGERVIVAHLDGQVSGFRLSDGALLFESPAGDIGAIERTAFTPDGKRFITVATMRDSAQSVQLRDATTGRSLRHLRGGVGGIESICVHPTSADLLVAGARTAVWALPQYREPAWRLPTAPIRSGFFRDDDLFLAPGKASLAAIDLRSGSTVWTPSRQSTLISATSPDGRTGVTQVTSAKNANPEFIIFQADDKGVRETAVARYGTDAEALVVNRDGTRIAMSGAWGGVAARLATTGEDLPDLDQSEIGSTFGLAWHGLDTAKLLGIFTRFGRRGMPGVQEWTISWDTNTGKRNAAVRSATPINCLATEHGGARLVEAGDDKIVRIRDANTLSVLRAFRAHDGPVNAIAWNPRGPMIATGSADRTVRLWNAESGDLIEELHLSLREPEALYFSPSGNRLACSIPGEKTLVWDLSELNLGMHLSDGSGRISTNGH